MMPKAYVIAEIRVSNPDGYADYRPLATSSVAQYGGQFLVRGGERLQLEGEDASHNSGWRTVVAEFPSKEQAETWYRSVEYTHAKSIRLANSEGRLLIVEGV
jgi:uncharacterized protein (DUF1330 family)